MDKNTIKLFYSYAQADEKYRDYLEKSLSMLRRYEGLDEWHFRKILPGSEIDKEISDKLLGADVILLLLSIDFLASTYCYDIEVAEAMKLHQSGKAVVIPVVLRECDWLNEKSPFRKLEGLPKNGLPISQWPDIDSAFNDVAQGIKKVILELKKKVRT